MQTQPTGTVTLLFSDIEGSTRLLEELGAERYGAALDAHREAIRAACRAAGGYEVDADGDAFFVAFPTAEAAVAAATDAQERLRATAVRARMGIHTGAPLAVPPGYVGLDVHKAARIMAAAHGGQVVLSEVTRQLVKSADVRDLGEHRLKDLQKAERLYQLGDGDFPPLRTLSRTNLPVAAGPLVGRERELERAAELLTTARLVTLTGPGGSGKTRLALQIAADQVDRFGGGVFFVPLAPLSHANGVPGAVAEALGLKPDGDLGKTLGDGAPRLLVLDNAEHLLGMHEVVAGLLQGDTHCLVTSRSPLRLAAEHELPIDPLPQSASIELFVLRAATIGQEVFPDDTVARICARLDDLPLAVELAAARTKVLSPRALLDRLDRVLPLLTHGPRDAPERQQTLTATIDWSYLLLDGAERSAFRKLAVFRGGIPVDGAAAIADADLDLLESLLDKNLLRRTGDERYLMLETVREYALDRLEEAGEGVGTRRRHAHWYWELLRVIDPETDTLIEIDRDQLDRFDAEVANTWAALETLLADDPVAALGLSLELALYWQWRSRIREGCAWLRRILATDFAPSPKLARAFATLGLMLTTLGNLDEAERALDEAIAVARTAGATRALVGALGTRAFLAINRNEWDQTVAYAREALEIAERSGIPGTIRRAEEMLGLGLAGLGEFDQAVALLERSLDDPSAQRRAMVSVNLGWINLQREDYAAAASHLEQALRIYGELAMGFPHALALAHVALIDVAEDRLEIAKDEFLQTLDAAIDGESDEWTFKSVSAIGAAVRRTHPETAARLLAAGAKLVAELGFQRDPPFAREFDRALDELRISLGNERLEQLLKEGRDLSADDAIAQARALAGS